MTNNAAADTLTIGLVVGTLTLAVCPLIGACAGICAATSQLRRLRDDMWPHSDRPTRVPARAEFAS
jgi:hypothetical protein